MKYAVRFCSCGRVHFVDQNKIDKAIENEKQVLVVCNNCGNSFVIGADKKQEYEECNICIDMNCDKCTKLENAKLQTIYNMYSFGMRDTEINDMTKIDSIVFTAGKQIRMMTGGEATFYGNNTFIDCVTDKPENITSDKWKEMRKTVNVQHTINWIRDDDKLEQMSHYYTNIDWKGTKYEKLYHS